MEGDNDMHDDDPSEDRGRRSNGAANGEEMNDEPELNGYQRYDLRPRANPIVGLRILTIKSSFLRILLSYWRSF
jgi:hypothetical protein